MKKLVLAAATAVATLSTVSPAQATLIDLSSYVDNNISTYTDGGAYPAPGTVMVGGIDFLLAGFGGGTGIIRGPANTPVAIAINEANVSAVYLIVNSADGGQAGTDVGSIVFNGTNGASETVDLIEGQNIRDHYSGVFNNGTSNVYATENYPGGAHFDVFKYSLPTFAGQTLSSISFTSKELGFPYGSPFIAGITTDVTSSAPGVPEPVTWVLMISGFGLVGGMMRRVRRAAGELVPGTVHPTATA